MKIDLKVEATLNEKRRFRGSPDLTPLVELVSVMLDEVMMVVVNARLEALETVGFGENGDDPALPVERRTKP